MVLVGVLALLYIYKILKLAFLKEPRDQYFISDGFPIPEEQPKKKKNTAKKKSAAKKSTTAKKNTPAKKKPVSKKSNSPTSNEKA